MAIPPHIHHLSELDLHAQTGPSPTDWMLRQRVSDLVEKAKKTGEESIVITRVYENIITRQAWHTIILANPIKVAFILRPVVPHTDYYDAIHKEALKKIYQIVRETEVDPKYMPQLLNLASKAADRVHGTVVQRQQIVSKNLNVEMNARDAAAAGGGEQSPEDMQAQIRQLETKLLDSSKDVSPAKK